MLRALSMLCLLVSLLTLSTSAQDVPTTLSPYSAAPLAPNPPTTRLHPLLTHLSHTNVTTAADINPGQLNLFNLTRPEGQRFFYLYVPSTYGQNKTGMPLAIFFHGYSANWQQGVYLNITRVAERMGWLLAFPQGTLSVQNYLGWNAGSCCIFNATSIVDDVQFARLAVRAIESAVLVDARRRYAMGWSNGAMMSEFEHNDRLVLSA